MKTSCVCLPSDWSVDASCGRKLRGHGFVDASAVIDAAGRHRLAAAGAYLRSRSWRCNLRRFFAQLFCAHTGMRTRAFMAYSAHVSLVALPDLDARPADALRALILAQHEQLISREREIEHLKLLLAKLQRMQFGRKSEKLERQIEQLELKLEELESKRSEQEPQRVSPSSRHRLFNSYNEPTRRLCPIICRDKQQTYEPKETVCPRMSGRSAQAGRGCLRDAGVRAGKFQGDSPCAPQAELHEAATASCRRERRADRSSAAWPGRVCWRTCLVSKYCDHLPLYRQSEMYAREGVELERSTLADWVGGSSRLLARWSKPCAAT